MASQLIITFPNVGRIDSSVTFTVLLNTGGPIQAVNKTKEKFITWVGNTIREKGTIWIEPDSLDLTLSDGTEAAILYVNWFEYDWNSTGFYTVTRTANVVTITIPDGYTFGSGSANIELLNIINEPASTYINIINSSILTDVGNECSRFNLNLTTDTDYVTKVINLVSTPVTATTAFSEELLRGVDYRISLYNSAGDEVRYPSVGYLNIPILSINDFEFVPTLSFSTGSIRINALNFGVLNYEYSINDVDWFTDGYFTGLAEGDYTIYIRDSIDGATLGCKVNTTITLDSASVRTIEPFIEISKANSISFVKRESPDNKNIFQNNSNSFSFEQKIGYIYCDEILYQGNDEVKIQIKTSYDTPSVILRDSDDTEIGLTLTQLTDNIGKFMSLDGIIQPYSTGQSVVYFNAGNIYNVSNAVIDTFELNGGLPEFAIIGGFIEVGGYGIFEIKDIVYLNMINKNCLVIDHEFTGSLPEELIVKSEYNLLGYNAFEFNIDWNLYGNGLYEVDIIFDDTDFVSETHTSENINVADYHDRTVAIKYFNTNNRDIFYKYDIQHFIRVPIEQVTLLVDDDIESNVNDNSVHVIKSTLNEGNTFTFGEVTRNMAIKLAIALSSEYVFIDGEGYVKADSIEFEPIENTNLIVLKVNMIKSGLGYNNIDEYSSSDGSLSGNITIPNFDVEGLELLITKPAPNGSFFISPPNFIKR